MTIVFYQSARSPQGYGFWLADVLTDVVDFYAEHEGASPYGAGGPIATLAFRDGRHATRCLYPYERMLVLSLPRERAA